MKGEPESIELYPKGRAWKMGSDNSENIREETTPFSPHLLHKLKKQIIFIVPDDIIDVWKNLFHMSFVHNRLSCFEFYVLS